MTLTLIVSAVVLTVCLLALLFERIGARRRQLELERTNRELLSVNSRLAELAAHDALTGLYNRRHFYEVLRTEFQRSRRHHRPLTVLMVDIDHFKRVNDQHGHLQGDRVLSQVGQLLSDELRQTDVVARYGGDEFALILPETDERSATIVAEKLRGTVEHRRFVNGGVCNELTISVGVAGLDQTLMSEDALMRLTDAALYRAKDAGRNRVECAPEGVASVTHVNGRKRGTLAGVTG